MGPGPIGPWLHSGRGPAWAWARLGLGAYLGLGSVCYLHDVGPKLIRHLISEHLSCQPAVPRLSSEVSPYRIGSKLVKIIERALNIIEEH